MLLSGFYIMLCYFLWGKFFGGIFDGGFVFLWIDCDMYFLVWYCVRVWYMWKCKSFKIKFSIIL